MMFEDWFKIQESHSENRVYQAKWAKWHSFLQNCDGTSPLCRNSDGKLRLVSQSHFSAQKTLKFSPGFPHRGGWTSARAPPGIVVSNSFSAESSGAQGGSCIDSLTFRAPCSEPRILWWLKYSLCGPAYDPCLKRCAAQQDPTGQFKPPPIITLWLQ